ncbi:AraC family transcriptional regulator [Euzebyella marina]|uniref:AraC family transcriptional regulator n=1 Tax=Euzebyella marina TaxID=1761453 RepID=A0A3G2L5T1_9FLAO|nr:AraC family transcriptional regulator [Euzebyella marina]AYN67624.1 AraC family transcriptional regulator [Euzebyella marina]MBG49746.1 AraC family transcriptional regulator [Pseudozobellia sp.]|tara:strand:- start:35136 stop:36182 length:1047 start_codon:yes stop_codon:yes gene_type:complete
MKSIKVKSLPLGDVIKNIASELNTVFTEHCEEYVLKIPDEYGKGEIRGINFEGGLGILLYDCQFLEDLEIQFVVNEVHPLKFLYCIEGELLHRFENDTVEHNIKQFQEAIVASEKHNGHILRFKKNVKSKVNSLEISRNTFRNKISCNLKSVDKKLNDLFSDTLAKKTFYHEGFYSLQLSNIFDEMKNFKEEDFIRKLYLEGKAYEMLTKQILLYHDDLNDLNKTVLLRQSEIRQIKSAVAIIEDEIAKLDKIDIIASRVGLNVNKMQEGFQYLFSKTVNAYIQDYRFKKMQELLTNSDLSISEIGDLVGLSSKSYISKVFKDKTGTTPNQFRKDYKESMTKLRKKNL